jgi:hypothetical protein
MAGEFSWDFLNTFPIFNGFLSGILIVIYQDLQYFRTPPNEQHAPKFK